MKKLVFCLALLTSLSVAGNLFAASSLWQRVQEGAAPSKEVQVLHPSHYEVFTLNESWLKWQMFSLSTNPDDGMIIDLPLPDGTTRAFKVWQDPMMPDELAARHPDIKTFTAHATNDQRVTAKLDFTIYGFHAMIFDGENTSFVDPFDRFHDGFYMVHYKRDEVRGMSERMKCEVKGEHEDGPAGESMDIMQKGLPKLAARTAGGWQLRTYRLALCANHFYCQAATGTASPTITACLSVMTTTMNRINGVYEREFSVHMNFVANEDTLIWPTNTGSINGADPFGSAATNSNGVACMGICQTQCTNRIGASNYDLGHIFTTGGGGISGLGIVCINSQKARSCTGSPSPVGDGYDIDYVAHEMGHQFGSQHTFANNTDGSCGGGNAEAAYAFEPGSGSTIMAYAGICSPDNLTSNSQAYFHSSSLEQIYGYLTTSADGCAVKTATGNKLNYVAPFTASYTIPYKTPFELTGPTAVDSVADTATTYCWEQRNRFGNTLPSGAASRFVNTYRTGPIFRSWQPVYTPTRVFPRISKVLAGTLNDAGADGNQGEKVPDTTRFLTFKMTVRAILAGKGTINFPDDTIHLDAVSTGAANGYAGFKVTSQGTTGISYTGGSSQTVTWNKVGTDAAPVNCAQVKIYMSRDGGNTWPYLVGTYPNTGTATVVVPNPATNTTQARFKVKGSGNVFFNVNSRNFTVTYNSSLPVTTTTGIAEAAQPMDIKVYPVPATDMLHISTLFAGDLHVIVTNAVGQNVYTGTMTNDKDIPVGAWARGVYYIQFVSAADGRRHVQPIVLQ